jgi:ABC-type polysaccharide/polyol phosphate export permease
MAGIIAAYRASALGEPIPWQSLGVAVVVAFGFLITGWWQFRRMDRHFADIV